MWLLVVFANGYRACPTNRFKWAEKNSTFCVNSLCSIDAFLGKALAPEKCNKPKKTVVRQLSKSREFPELQRYQLPAPKLYAYMLETLYQDSFDKWYASKQFTISSLSNSNGGLIMAVHLRGGSPDGGRKALSIEQYMSKVLEREKDLNQQQQHLGHVLFLGDSTFTQDSDELQRLSGQTDRFKVSIWPHTPETNLGKDAPKEAEFALEYEQKDGLRSTLYHEFARDILAFRDADLVIGVHSNLLLTYSLLRQTRPEPPQEGSLCWIDTHTVDLLLQCGAGSLDTFVNESIDTYMGLVPQDIK
jgi:hypothetical protein